MFVIWLDQQPNAAMNLSLGPPPSLRGVAEQRELGVGRWRVGGGAGGSQINPAHHLITADVNLMDAPLP